MKSEISPVGPAEDDFGDDAGGGGGEGDYSGAESFDDGGREYGEIDPIAGTSGGGGGDGGGGVEDTKGRNNKEMGVCNRRVITGPTRIYK